MRIFFPGLDLHVKAEWVEVYVGALDGASNDATLAASIGISDRNSLGASDRASKETALAALVPLMDLRLVLQKMLHLMLTCSLFDTHHWMTSHGLS